MQPKRIPVPCAIHDVVTGLGQAGQLITTLPRKTWRAIREGMTYESRLVEFLEHQVAPADFEGAFSFTDAMDLQTNEALWVTFEFLLVGQV